MSTGPGAPHSSSFQKALSHRVRQECIALYSPALQYYNVFRIDIGTVVPRIRHITVLQRIPEQLTNRIALFADLPEEIDRGDSRAVPGALADYEYRGMA